MKILSIDVGMKCLAYCLFTTIDKEYNIEKWGIIDLCHQQNHKCCGKIIKKLNLAKKMQNIIKILSIFAKYMRKNKLLIYPPTNLNKFILKKQRLMFLNIFVKNTTLFKMSRRKKLKRRNIKN